MRTFLSAEKAIANIKKGIIRKGIDMKRVPFYIALKIKIASLSILIKIAPLSQSIRKHSIQAASHLSVSYNLASKCFRRCINTIFSVLNSSPVSREY